MCYRPKANVFLRFAQQPVRLPAFSRVQSKVRYPPLPTRGKEDLKGS